MNIHISGRHVRFRRRLGGIGLVGAIACGVALATAGPASATEALDAGATWVSPTRGTVTEVFDPTFHRFAKVANECGTPVYAASAGTVSSTAENGGAAGVSAGIDHGAGLSTTYGSLGWSSLLVAPGDHVAAGDQIAVTGMTGATLSCGLRFAVSDLTKTPTAQDPVRFLAERGVTLGG